MDAFTQLKQTIQTADIRELFIYLVSFLSVLTGIMGLLIYIHVRKIHKYQDQLVATNKQRKETQSLLQGYKTVNQRQAEVEEILNQDKNFRIEPSYTQLLQKIGLTKNQPEEPTAKSGEAIKGKTERELTSHLTNMSMKQVTDLLATLADIKQLYAKELTITKVPNTKTVNIDLVIATLQPSG